jgi:hypothetical protein
MIDFKEGKIKYYDYELLAKISNDLSLNYSIATHNILLNDESKNKLPSWYHIRMKAITHEDIAKNILKKGLKINDKYQNIFYTMVGYGYLKNILEDKDERKSTFLKYNYWKEKKVNNIIIAIPPTIRLDGRDYFIGVLENDYYSIMRDFPNGNNILNTMLIRHKIPSEFIYGYYSRDTIGDENQTILQLNDFKDKKIFRLKKNPNHISKMKESKQEEFYRNLLNETGVTKEMLSMVENKDYSINNKIINNTIDQKEAYESNFNGKSK